LLTSRVAPAGQAVSSSPAPVRREPAEKGYLRRPSPTWPEVVDAADRLRHDLDVSKPLWGEACLAMGREQAAIALAVVSTKPRETRFPVAPALCPALFPVAASGAVSLAPQPTALRQFMNS
jgi:hypothetical protein